MRIDRVGRPRTNSHLFGPCTSSSSTDVSPFYSEICEQNFLCTRQGRGLRIILFLFSIGGPYGNYLRHTVPRRDTRAGPIETNAGTRRVLVALDEEGEE